MEWFCELCTSRHNSKFNHANTINFGDLKQYRRSNEENILTEKLQNIRNNGESIQDTMVYLYFLHNYDLNNNCIKFMYI